MFMNYETPTRHEMFTDRRMSPEALEFCHVLSVSDSLIRNRKKQTAETSDHFTEKTALSYKKILNMILADIRQFQL